LRFLVEQIGLDAFRGLYETELAGLRAQSPAPFAAGSIHLDEVGPASRGIAAPALQAGPASDFWRKSCVLPQNSIRACSDGGKLSLLRAYICIFWAIVRRFIWHLTFTALFCVFIMPSVYCCDACPMFLITHKTPKAISPKKTIAVIMFIIVPP